MQNRNLIFFSISIIGALVLLMTFGVVGYQSVYAQTSVPATTPTAPGGQTHPKPNGFRFGATDQDLATALGITVDKLQAAYQSADAEALKQAVSKGLITQDQADKFSANGNQRHFGWPGMMMGGSNGIDYNAILANALGITTDKLQSAYQQAYNTGLDNAVKNGTLTQQQADAIKGRSALARDNVFQTAIKTAIVAALKVAVSTNVITQAQADAITNDLNASNGVKPGMGMGMGRGFMPGFGSGFGGFGGHRFGKPGGSNTPAPTTTPSA